MWPWHVQAEAQNHVITHTQLQVIHTHTDTRKAGPCWQQCDWCGWHGYSSLPHRRRTFQFQSHPSCLVLSSPVRPSKSPSIPSFSRPVPVPSSCPVRAMSATGQAGYSSWAGRPSHRQGAGTQWHNRTCNNNKGIIGRLGAATCMG